MKLLIVLLFCLVSLFGEKLEWNKLNDEQKENAIKVYQIAKEYDLAQTMLAIAWQESRLGKIPINLEDKASCGVHHIHIKTFLWQNNLKNTITSRNKYCAELIQDVELSTRNAIKYYKYSLKKWKNNQQKAIMSYNVGFDLVKHKTAGKKYYKNVKQHIAEAKDIINEIEKNSELETFLKEFASLNLELEQ